MKKNYLYLILGFCFLCAPFVLSAQTDYKSIIDSYLNSQKTKLSSENINWEVISISKDSNRVHVYGSQVYNGIPIFGHTGVYLLKNNQVATYNQKYLDLGKFSKKVDSQITPSEAVSILIKKLKVPLQFSAELKERKSTQEYIFTNKQLQEDIFVKRYYFTESQSLEPAWKVEILAPDGHHWWSALISSIDGRILFLNDWVVSCKLDHFISENRIKNTRKIPSETKSVLAGEQYRVFPLPLTDPNDGPSQLLTNPQNLIASPFGWHDTNGAEGAEYTITRGNNVWAYEDTDGSGGTEGSSPNGGSSLVFDFPFDLNQNPNGYLRGATTNLFYVNNVFHDILYLNGFDEAAGNFQATNYSGTGRGFDFVDAISQDGSALNNATFATPPDGSRPRMRMFIWSAPGDPGEVLEIESPNSLQGNYVGVPAAIGNTLSTTELRGNLVLVTDNNSSFNSNDANDGCDTFLNTGAISGNIAVMRRGNCDFDVKIKKAQNAGAKAVIIVNDSGDLVTMNGDDTTIFIPSVMIPEEDGERIISALQSGTTVSGYLQNRGPFQKDGSLDNTIILHEYAHGLSNRLTGGPDNADCLTACLERDSNGNCISSTYTEQMGEGWSDYFALLLTMKTDDTADDSRLIASYVLNDDNSDAGIGLRPYPYSRDMTVNPLTYDDTNNASLLPGPHGVGTVWTAMLWDLTWDLIDFYGFDTDFYTGDGGNNIAMKLIIEAMKIQPCQPGFVDGRDAILAADEVLYGGKHACLIWKAFARRGLGVNARQGSSESRLDQIENFDVPAEFQGNCVLGVEDVDDANKAFFLFPNPSRNQVNVFINGNFGEGNITIFDLNGRKVLTQKQILSDQIEINTSSLSQGVYILQVKNDTVSASRKLIIN
ncbi:T9SS-dependent M36 family metallopeptidase [Leeuwenhoekiella sp. H156]|uniref:T9SS-dependent M36 family metallopeptidase n=1 Tax=Leeuwenhoekiella sp. H156 TaxID=3450128 RepID=UPI003FA43520